MSEEQTQTVDEAALEKAIAAVEAEAQTLEEAVIKSTPEERTEGLMQKGLSAAPEERE